MEKIKKIVTILISFVIFMIVIIIFIIMIGRNRISQILAEEQEHYNYYLENPASVVNGNKPGRVKEDNIYYEVQEIIQQYIYHNINKDKEYLYHVVDKKYSDENQITNDNILQKIEMYKNDNYKIESLFALNGSQYTTFYAKLTNENREIIFLMINIDFNHRTFSIIPSYEQQYLENIDKTIEGRQGTEESIEVNQYNKWYIINLSEQQIANLYFKDYKEKILRDIDSAYNLLDDKTKSQKFNQINEFKQYIESNKISELSSYHIKNNDNVKQLICVDKNGNYFIFKIKSVMEYTVEIYKNDDIDTENELAIEAEDLKEVTIDFSTNIVNDKDNYFTVANCINQYISYINHGNEEAVYSILDNKDRKENISKKFDKAKTFSPEEMYFVSNILELYYVKGFIDNADRKEISQKEEYYISVVLDKSNYLFSIIPITKKQYIDREILDIPDYILNKEYNTFTVTKATDEFMSRRIFNEYKTMLLNETDKAYHLLDERYKQLRFKNKNNYDNYVSKYKNEISSSIMEAYKVNKNIDHTEYICKDQYDNYYVFLETDIMKYTAQLDSYTLENDNAKTTYRNSDNQNKVMHNVDKYIMMLNHRDYKNAYQLLDETFKKNYYPTEEVFENYMSSNLPGKYRISFTEFSEQVNASMQKIELEDIKNSENKITMTVIMKLEENTTNFVISFSI